MKTNEEVKQVAVKAKTQASHKLYYMKDDLELSFFCRIVATYCRTPYEMVIVDDKLAEDADFKRKKVLVLAQCLKLLMESSSMNPVQLQASLQEKLVKLNYMDFPLLKRLKLTNGCALLLAKFGTKLCR